MSTTSHNNQQAITNSELLYQQLIENCPIAFIISRQGNIIFINNAGLEMFGYNNANEVLGTNVVDYVAPDYRQDAIERVSRSMQGETLPKKYEAYGIKADGSHFPYEGRTVKLMLEDGEATAIFLTDISQYKNTEATLTTSEKKYRELINQASSIILRWNPNGVITFFNEYAQQLFGYSETDILGKNIVGTIVIENKSTHQDILRITTNIKKNPSLFEDIEYECTTNDGKPLWITWKNRAVYSAAGELLEILSIGTDISKRKKTEEKIRESERELKNILNSLQDTYYRVDQHGYIIRVSPSVEQLFGYTPQEAVKIQLADLYVDPDGRNKFLKALKSNNGKISNYQAEMKCKDNSTIWVSTNAHFFYNEQGEIVGLEGTTRNITENIIIEKALQHSEERFKAIFNAISDAVIFVDENRRILLINPAVTRIFGYTFSELQHKSTECIYANKEDFIRLGANRFNTNASNNPTLYEIPYLRKDGSVFIGESFGTKIEDESGNFIGFIGIIRDISERKMTHERLRLSQTIFESAGKAILVTDSRTNIIDVNNAFTEITGYRKSDLVNKTPLILLTDQYNEDFFCSVSNMLITSGYWQGELWGKKKNGDLYPMLATISVVKNEHGFTNNYITVFSDISYIKETEERLEQLAHYDQLTGLPNRMLFHDHLHSALARAKRHGEGIAVMYIDLDGFKQVNDTLGHAEGDKLLVQIGKKLQSCVREEDTVARLGGDEFAIIINELQSMDYLDRLADRIVIDLATNISYESRELHVSGSIGIATYPHDGANEEKLVQNADQAMYHAKQKGKNTYQFFDVEMNLSIMNKIHLEHDLRHAIKHNELFVQYQPKFDLQKKRVVGIEALVRWHHPEHGELQPADFIPLAEESTLIFSLGKQVLEIACRSAQKWYSAGRHYMPIAVNISAKQIRDNHFVDLIRNILEQTQLPANLLEIEITESLLMEDIEKTIVILRELKDMGLSISIDDFGTGYSSLSYLKKLPVDTLKIDRSFVMDIAENDDDRAIVSAIISMAKSLNLRVIAEGVENQNQLDFLRNNLCHEIQGYFLSEPVELEDLESVILKIEEESKKQNDALTGII